jgi:opacity protein-like surface antigen
MNMKMIAAACVAFCSAGAFAAATPSCGKALPGFEGANYTHEQDGLVLLKSCSPEITFYSAGASAVSNAVTATVIADGKIFNKSKPFVTINLSGNSNAKAWYGFGATGTAWADKRVAVIYNSTNGSTAGVIQLLSGLKTGSVEGGVDQKEYITIQLHTAAAQKAGTAMPDADVTVTTPSKLAPVVTLATTRVADFKTAWGVDKQKVAHMAFSDVRPSEATPGQVAKWTPSAFPETVITMQGFGVAVNNNMYKALMARDVRQGRLPASCDSTVAANLVLASCQPGVSTADMTSLITGKAISAAAFLGDAAETRQLVLNRRPASSGTQAATQIRFGGQANFIGKAPLNGMKTADAIAAFDMAGAETSTNTAGVITATEVAINPNFKVFTNSGTGDLIKKIGGDTDNLSIGVASLDNKASSKFSATGGAATPEAQAVRWVKVDGRSPNFKGDGTVDGDQRAGLQDGYDFAFEFVTLKNAKSTGVYLGIYDAIVAGLKDPAANLTGMAYLNSTNVARNTAWTRNLNNYFPLNKNITTAAPVTP